LQLGVVVVVGICDRRNVDDVPGLLGVLGAEDFPCRTVGRVAPGEELDRGIELMRLFVDS
jgi:hypothetical protein